MKTSKLLLFFLFFISLSACTKEEIEYEHTGYIHGIDYSECSCCGGQIISIDDEFDNGRFEALPDGVDIDLSNAENEPVAVFLNYKILSNCLGITHIEIQQIKIVD